ncbi:MAG: hypothetical protein BJ554DRAFT_2629, partial [Olpidium bornovanus]
MGGEGGGGRQGSAVSSCSARRPSGVAVSEGREERQIHRLLDVGMGYGRLSSAGEEIQMARRRRPLHARNPGGRDSVPAPARAVSVPQSIYRPAAAARRFSRRQVIVLHPGLAPCAQAAAWIAARAAKSTARGELLRFLAEHLLTPAQAQKLAATAAGTAAKPATGALAERLYGRGDPAASPAANASYRKPVRLQHLIHAFRLVQITSLSPLQLRAEIEDDIAHCLEGVGPDEVEFHLNATRSPPKYQVVLDENLSNERKPKGRGSWKEDAENSARGCSGGAGVQSGRMESAIEGLDSPRPRPRHTPTPNFSSTVNCAPPPKESIDARFSDVHLPEAAIRTIQKTIILPLIRPELFSSGVLARQQISGILLFGPPGTGKTLLAKAVASESGCTMMSVDLSGVLAKWVGESEKNIRAVFTLAAKLAPTVLFVDELDALFSARKSDTQEYRRSAVNEFMVRDRSRSSGERLLSIFLFYSDVLDGPIVRCSRCHPFSRSRHH